MAKSNATLVSAFRRFVDVHGAAQVAVWLGYKDTRSLGVWLATGNIPRARIELVKATIKRKAKRNGKKGIKSNSDIRKTQATI